jgi:hypothetical protein
MQVRGKLISGLQRFKIVCWWFAGDSRRQLAVRSASGQPSAAPRSLRFWPQMNTAGKEI